MNLSAPMAILAVVCALLNASYGAAQNYDIGGSSTVYPISLVMAEEYNIEHPGSIITVRINGTGGGFIKFCDGDYPLTGASRPIKQSEMDVCASKGISFIELPIAFDALTVVLNPNDNFTECLSTKQLQQLFIGDSDIQRWSQLDASFPDEEISFFVPGVDSGTYDYFTETIIAGDERLDVLSSEDDDILATGIGTTPYAIGYFGYAYYLEHADELKALEIDDGHGCIAPSLESILDGSYTPLSRPLFIYVNAAALEDPNIKDLVNIYLSEDFRFLIGDTGYALLPEEAYALVQERFEDRLKGSIFQDFQPGMSVIEVLMP